MNIAFISRWFFEEHRRSGGPGGGEQHRVAAYRELGHEVIVLSQSADAVVLEQREIDGIPIVLTPRWQRAPVFALLDKIAKPITRHRKLFTDAWHLHVFLKRFGPFDLIEAQCEEPDGLVVALLSCFQKLPPWAVQVFALRYHFHNCKPVFDQTRVLGFVFHRARLVKANSQLVAEHVERDYGCPRNKIVVVPHNLTRQFLESTTPMAAVSETRSVLCLAALNEKKGIRFFIEAASLLKRRLPRVSFVSVGGATGKEAYAREMRELACRLQIGDDFQWQGELRGDKLREEIAAATVVVIPSLFDEWNRAAVEAVSQGRPVVITDQCGVAPWIERAGCGVIVTAADNKALAAGIEQVLMNPAFSAAAVTAALSLRAEFSPHAIAKGNLDHFQRLVRS